MYSLVHWLKQEEIYIQQYNIYMYIYMNNIYIYIYSVCACVNVSGAEKAHSFFMLCAEGPFSMFFHFIFIHHLFV